MGLNTVQIDNTFIVPYSTCMAFGGNMGNVPYPQGQCVIRTIWDDFYGIWIMRETTKNGFISYIHELV